MIKVHQKTRLLMLVLLALLLTAARASAQKTVSFAQMANGTVTASHTIATEGQTVSVTVVPDEGYQLKEGSLLVEKTTNPSDADRPQQSRRRAPGVGGYVSVTRTDTYTYTFLMPETDVLVTATFELENQSGINETYSTSKPSSRVAYSLAGRRIKQLRGNQIVIINGRIILLRQH